MLRDIGHVSADINRVSRHICPISADTPAISAEVTGVSQLDSTVSSNERRGSAEIALDPLALIGNPIVMRGSYPKAIVRHLQPALLR
jgi:hypothetical protein